MSDKLEQDDSGQKKKELTKSYVGAGLDLYHAKTYDIMLDGKIWCTSEEGRGSAFYFAIPYHPV